MNGLEISVQAVKIFDSDFDIQRLGATLQRGTARQSFPLTPGAVHLQEARDNDLSIMTGCPSCGGQSLCSPFPIKFNVII